ncbi:MAG: hypothetical protein ABI905_03095 [Betaproteobacteria bacterium]
MTGLKLWLYSIALVALGALAGDSLFNWISVISAVSVGVFFYTIMIRPRGIEAYPMDKSKTLVPPMQGGG